MTELCKTYYRQGAVGFVGCNHEMAGFTAGTRLSSEFGNSIVPKVSAEDHGI
jgi:hypothetical protein